MRTRPTELLLVPVTAGNTPLPFLGSWWVRPLLNKLINGDPKAKGVNSQIYKPRIVKKFEYMEIFLTN